MNQFLLNALSKALNGYLKLDPESTTRIKELAGKTITVELLPFHFIFQCEFTSTHVNIHTNESLAAIAKIKGTPLQMLGAMLVKSQRDRFFADDIVIEGNAEIGLQLVALFDDMQIDWEEYFSHLAGDVPAYHISRFAKRIKNWLSQCETSFTQNINEYLHEEKHWLPGREALHDFFNDIDSLRMDTDRMEAKMNVLKNQLSEEGHQA